MTRPRCKYHIEFSPKVTDFEPQGGSRLCVELTRAETEALRLKNLQGMCQMSAAKRMNVSQSTFQRVLSSAHRKVSEAVVQGKGIKIVAKIK